MLKRIKQMPEEFRTYEEAAEFWETHDSTDFMDILEEVDIKVDLQKRHYLIELDKSTAEVLQESARRKGVSPGHLASELLQEQLIEAE